MNITKILVPVDGSSYSKAALEMGIRLAGRNDASIVLLTVRREVPKLMMTEAAAKVLRASLNEAAQDLLETYRPELEASGVPFEMAIASGRRGDSIVEEVKARGCDLVVMGSKGKSDLQGLILGSVTHVVLHAAPCSVLVVK